MEGNTTSQKVDAPVKTGYNFPGGCIDIQGAPPLTPAEAGRIACRDLVFGRAPPLEVLPER